MFFYSSLDIEDRWRSSWNGDLFFILGTIHSKGVAVLIDSKLDIQVLNVNADKEGRYIVIECIIQGIKCTIVTVYFPVQGKTTEQTTFLKDFDKTLEKLKVKDNPIIIGGDFNLI